MKAQFDEFWNSPVHQEFVSNLNVDRVSALRDLLLLAALADDIFTVEERIDVAEALEDLPGLDEEIRFFERAEAIDYVDDLYEQHEEEGDLMIENLLIRLGDEANLRHAFEAVVILMATNEKAQSERFFAQRLGVLMELDDEYVDELLSDHGWEMEDG